MDVRIGSKKEWIRLATRQLPLVLSTTSRTTILRTITSSMITIITRTVFNLKIKTSTITNHIRGGRSLAPRHRHFHPRQCITMKQAAKPPPQKEGKRQRKKAKLPKMSLVVHYQPTKLHVLECAFGRRHGWYIVPFSHKWGRNIH